MKDLPAFDVTARKVHQWVMVGLVVIAFVLGGRLSSLILALAGLIMVAGRFWWPADIVRQLVWRVLEPAGVLVRRELNEDHETRRLARVLGGLTWLVSSVLLLANVGIIGWALSFSIAAMVVLDAAVDFCALCFLFAQLGSRGMLPRALQSGIHQNSGARL
jgi:hypothetical protein